MEAQTCEYETFVYEYGSLCVSMVNDVDVNILGGLYWTDFLYVKKLIRLDRRWVSGFPINALNPLKM